MPTVTEPYSRTASERTLHRPAHARLGCLVQDQVVVEAMARAAALLLELRPEEAPAQALALHRRPQRLHVRQLRHPQRNSILLLLTCGVCVVVGYLLHRLATASVTASAHTRVNE